MRAGGQRPAARSLQRSPQLPALQQCPSAGAGLAGCPMNAEPALPLWLVWEEALLTVGLILSDGLFYQDCTPMADSLTDLQVGQFRSSLALSLM